MTKTQAVGEICAQAKNYFVQDIDVRIGYFKIENGVVSPSVDLADGQYFRIVNSVFNDGVHQQGEELKDEKEFYGAVWLMRVPQDVIDGAEAIVQWEADHAGDINSPYTSESFGGYSYSKGTNADGTLGTHWANQAQFASLLNKYRRIRII